MTDKELDANCHMEARNYTGTKCPFCGGTNPEVFWMEDPGSDKFDRQEADYRSEENKIDPCAQDRPLGKRFYVSCFCCHASGPEKPDIEEAMQCWMMVSEKVWGGNIQ